MRATSESRVGGKFMAIHYRTWFTRRNGMPRLIIAYQAQTEWGRRVLARLELRGDEDVIDAGCGTGRLTAHVMERLPRGRLIAIDRSWNMLLTARANLRPAFSNRIRFACVELPWLPFSNWADLVFSTATFHWVRDHERLFTEIFAALKPGGRLFAQCGGGPNLMRAHALAEDV